MAPVLARGSSGVPLSWFVASGVVTDPAAPGSSASG